MKTVWKTSPKGCEKPDRFAGDVIVMTYYDVTIRTGAFRLKLPFGLHIGVAVMHQSVREPLQWSGRLRNASTSAASVESDLSLEKHYSVIEISQLWSLSEKTVRKIFENEPGVIQWGTGETSRKRGYRTLRVPETVLQRVHRKLRPAS